MRILIAGASGMVGSALVSALSPKHDLILVGREQQKLSKKFSGPLCLSFSDLTTYREPVDVVIHLSGQNIGESYWTTAVKHKILASRVETAQQLLNWIRTIQAKQPRILAANAIGYYEFSQLPVDEDTLVNEATPQSFLQQVAFNWQNIWKTDDLALSVCWMRFGVILKKNQGMLKKLWPSFVMGAGSSLGNGKQMISWIDLDDLVKAILWLLDHPSLEGPINLVAPHAVSQKDFATCFAKVLRRPLFLKLPERLVTLLFGQMGQELLLSGQQVLPKRLLEAGFKFDYPTLDAALKHEYLS